MLVCGRAQQITVPWKTGMFSVLALAERHGIRPSAFHAFVTLPEPWRADDFVPALAKDGVAVSPARAFAVPRCACRTAAPIPSR